MKVTIRKATEADFQEIFNLNMEFSIFQRTPEKFTVTLQQMVEEQNYFQCMVAAVEDQKIVGFATTFFAFYSWSGKSLYLEDLYVKDEFRKLGIGRKLMDAVIAYAKETGCRKLRWQVSKWNSYAIEMYKKMGAKIEETEINCLLPLGQPQKSELFQKAL
jgi:ribosomal protein S18 acetylase RimI-like enzyme